MTCSSLGDCSDPLANFRIGCHPARSERSEASWGYAHLAFGRPGALPAMVRLTGVSAYAAHVHEALQQAVQQEGDAHPHGASASSPAGHRAFAAPQRCPLSDTCSAQVGLDAAGKTTILYKLKLGEIVTTIPTIGEPPLPHERTVLPLMAPRWSLNVPT